MDYRPEQIREHIHSKKGRNMMTFIVFLLISAGLWYVMSVNDTVERQYDLDVVVMDMPRDVDMDFYLENDSLIGPDGNLGKYTIVVKEQALSNWRKKNVTGRPLNLHFTDFRQTIDGSFYLPSAKMEGALDEYFGKGMVIVTWKPSIVAFKGRMQADN